MNDDAGAMCTKCNYVTESFLFLARLKRRQKRKIGKTDMTSIFSAVASINCHRRCHSRQTTTRRTTTTTTTATTTTTTTKLIRRRHPNRRCALGAFSRAFDRNFGARRSTRSARPCQRPAKGGEGGWTYRGEHGCACVRYQEAWACMKLIQIGRELKNAH